MVKVIFKNESGVYWAVCESLCHMIYGRYRLDNVQEDNVHNMPRPWVEVPEYWKIISIEGA